MKSIQYTIRNVPPEIDHAIRKHARRKGVSFNSSIIEMLKKQTNVAPEKSIFEEMRGAGTLDQGFFDAIEDQSKIDEELWK